MRPIAAIVFAVCISACAGEVGRPDDDAVYTLLRGSALDTDPIFAASRPSGRPPLRIHVATFDAADGAAFNAENCETALGLFQAQPGVTVRYWCEKGRYRK